jgi:hypothetical protein
LRFAGAEAARVRVAEGADEFKLGYWVGGVIYGYNGNYAVR